jgi:hypothetical protein
MKNSRAARILGAMRELRSSMFLLLGLYRQDRDSPLASNSGVA